jgi:predicted dehydrogenase
LATADDLREHTLRIGILGSGFMARFHLEALRSVRHCRVSAVHSPTPAHREDFAARADATGLGPCRPLPTAEDLVAADDVDAVWLVGPNDTRLEHMGVIHDLVAAGEARLHGVAAEKPLGRTLAEARAILALAEDVGLPHGYLENQVFAPAVQRGKDILWRRAVGAAGRAGAAGSAGSAGSAGRPYLARASEEHSGPHSPWFWDGTRQGGGVLLDMMCHSVEVARFLLTAPGAPRDSLQPVTALGTTASLKWSRPEYAERLRRDMDPALDYRRRPSEDVAQGTIELVDEAGQPVVIQATTSWAYVGPGLRIAIEVLGPEYSMAVDSLSTSLSVFVSRDLGQPRSGGAATGDDLVEKQNAEQGLLRVVEDEAASYGYVAENRHMVEALRHRRAPEETWADGVGTMELLMALYRSAELGRTIRLGEEDLTSYTPSVAVTG